MVPYHSLMVPWFPYGSLMVPYGSPWFPMVPYTFSASHFLASHPSVHKWEIFYLGRCTNQRCCLDADLHSRKLTWNLKMMVSNRNLLLQVSIFGCHVSFRECSVNGKMLPVMNGLTPFFWARGLLCITRFKGV